MVPIHCLTVLLIFSQDLSSVYFVKCFTFSSIASQNMRKHLEADNRSAPISPNGRVFCVFF